MSLKALRTLCEIAQKGSFAAAGGKLGLTQAAVSIQIRQLEEQLGTRLFDRIGRNQVLNHDGRKVLERAEQIVALYSQLGDGLGAAGLIHLVTSGRFRRGQNVVFLHTGGTPALFGYPEILEDASRT